ncbi:hypothetical protein Avbf_02643 [Armadillidium vulgare]|nr:hypothetical protein Avbf_02643 [Armadillidium vulgare]
MTDTSFADRLKKPASEDSLTKSVLSSEVKEASDILSKAIKKRGKYATAANCAKSGNFLGGIFNKGKKQSITEQPKDIQQKSALVNADSSNSCKAVNELKRVEILPKNIEKNDKQIHSTNEAVQDGVLIKTFQKEIPAVPETRGRPSVGRISSRAPSNIVSDVVSKENSISGKPKFENWFKEVQEASKSPVREKPVWAREKTSPLHSHIQKTRSFYDEISSSPARQQGKQSVEVRKSRGYVFDKQSGNSCPKDAAQSERSPNPPPGCLQPKNHHVSCSDIPSSPHLSLPSTVKNPINRVASMSTVSSPSAPRTASLSSFVSPVLSFVSSPHVAPINSPPCSPRSVSRSVTPIPSASVSTEVTLRLPFQTPFANIRTVDVFGSVVIPAHKLEEGEMSSSSSSSSPSTSSSETAHEDSAHGGQERSAPVGGLMDEGGFVNPVPPPRPLHFTSPLDVIENARKVRSLPGFYKSPTSPPQSFREAFAYAYQSHPLPLPFSENVHNDSKERHTEKPPEEKKSRSILGGIFRRRKKGSSSSLSSSSENESDTPKKTFFARRIKKRESQSRKKEKDKDKEDGEEPKIVKSPVKDGVNLPVTPYSYGRQTTYLITTDNG